MTWKILVADRIAAEGVDILKKEAGVDVKIGLEPQELRKLICNYDALVVRSDTKVTAEIIEAGEKLQVVGRAGVGVDNIDLKAATRHGVVVVNAPAGNTVSAAEHTIALMLALARNIPQAYVSLKSGEWKRKDFVGTEVRGKILGIIGLGRVGSEVARRAKGMEMIPIAYDPMVSVDYAKGLGVKLVSKEELLRESDFITVHTPLSEATRGFIGTDELNLVKPSVLIINTARGGIVDEEALFKAVEDRKVAGAAIDVFSKEPPPAENPLLKSKSGRIIVTPHLGASTVDAQKGVATDVAGQVLTVLKGQPARYAINAPLIPPETLSFMTPFFKAISFLGKLAVQLVEGQLESVAIKYEGGIANYNTEPLKAVVIRELLDPSTEERINFVNASIVAQERGLKVAEQKSATCENYSSLITLEVTTHTETTIVAGTLIREEPHFVRVNNYWLDIVPTEGYWLFSNHPDRPGLIGQVGAITGAANVDISSMQVARLAPHGRALMVLGLDEPLSEEDQHKILAIPDVHSVRMVKF